MTPRGSGLLGTVVVRAWLEPDSTVSEVRARVLVIHGVEAELHEAGMAAGLDAVLELISEALRVVFSETESV